MSYLPWWFGAIGLGAVTLGHYALLGTTFGVSGTWERVIFWRQERSVERTEALLDGVDFDAELAAATLEAFGDLGISNGLNSTNGLNVIGSGSTALATEVGTQSVGIGKVNPGATIALSPMDASAPHGLLRVSSTAPVASQAIFMVCVFLGGLAASLVSGNFKVQTNMGDTYALIVTDSWLMWPLLLLGGILVGFGTRLCGGCSSGHGLNGCSRLQPISLLATSIFFGTAVVVSTLLWKVI
jgi:uncharacterized protein